MPARPVDLKSAVRQKPASRAAALSHFLIVTNVTVFTKLFARTNSPSRVTEVLRTMLPPPGIGQLWNFAVFGSKRRIMFGGGIRLTVPDDVVNHRNAVGLRLRSARRLPFT